MQENRERKQAGLPPLRREFPQKQQQQEEPPKFAENPTSDIPATASAQNYSFFQAQIQNQLAQFQAEKFTQIAKEASKEKHILYMFEDKPQPPKLGEKKYTRASLKPVEVYYNEIDYETHDKLDKMRAKVADLTSIRTKQSSTIGSNGQTIPALMPENVYTKTHLDDATFNNINVEIDKLNKYVLAEMALWYYGITSDILPRLESSSLTNAIEAGLYREMYGLVKDSKNLAVS